MPPVPPPAFAPLRPRRRSVRAAAALARGQIKKRAAPPLGRRQRAPASPALVGRGGLQARPPKAPPRFAGKSPARASGWLGFGRLGEGDVAEGVLEGAHEIAFHISHSPPQGGFIDTADEVELSLWALAQ